MVNRLTVAAMALLLSVACSSPSGSGSGSGGATQADPNAAAAALAAKRDPNSLMVVDCMLPGQVRKLGSKLTYLTQPRPVKTSGVDCEIRGGEYVALDRATYADSLRVWLPLAEGGDPKAQTFVGEIFEKGLGVSPDYPAAIQWYTKAADQGYGPAQINLGQLYELGNGVPKDPQIALDWYRKASGLSDLDQEFVSFVGDASQYQELRTQLAQESERSQQLRTQVTSLHREVGKSREERANLEEKIRGEAAQLEGERSRLAAEAKRTQEQRRALEQERAQIAKARTAPPPPPAPAPAPAPAPTPPPPVKRPEEDAKVQSLIAKVERREKELTALEQSLAKQQAETTQRQAELDKRGQELTEMDAEIKRTANEAEKQRAKLQKEVETQVTRVATGPKIMLIDPPLPLTRSSDTADVVSQGKEQKVIGKVEAPAGLMSLLVNDVEEKVDDEGFFQTQIRVRQVGTDVSIVAIDQQGKRATRQFVLRRGDRGPIATPARRQTPIRFETASKSIDFGKYHALVIGNANYTNLPALETARADAQGVAALLKGQYGFKVTTLYDADRYQILMALNDLRGRLGPKDNLLVYYAGHGQFDRADDQGYWQPIDAETGNKVNWIANDAITDILNAIKAKHILVVADSCYSGSLTGTAIPRIDVNADAKTRIDWEARVESKTSRTALTSGGLAPVLDGGGGTNSIFARALLDILKNNDDVLDGYRLYSEVSARVRYRARSASFQQKPQYAPIRFGQHGGGEFFFVPTG